MTEQPQYNSAFVRELSDVLNDIFSQPDDAMPDEMPGGFFMTIIAKSVKPEMPGFLAALDGNDGMRNMFGGIILRLGDAVRADNKAMKEEAKKATKEVKEESSKEAEGA